MLACVPAPPPPHTQRVIRNSEGEESQKSKHLKESMELNWKHVRKVSLLGVYILSLAPLNEPLAFLIYKISTDFTCTCRYLWIASNLFCVFLTIIGKCYEWATFMDGHRCIWKLLLLGWLWISGEKHLIFLLSYCSTHHAYTCMVVGVPLARSPGMRRYPLQPWHSPPPRHLSYWANQWKPRTFLWPTLTRWEGRVGSEAGKPISSAISSRMHARKASTVSKLNRENKDHSCKGTWDAPWLDERILCAS